MVRRMGCLLTSIVVVLSWLAHAEAATMIIPKHLTDGGFNLHNDGLPTSEGPEWSGTGVSKTIFPIVGLAGGSTLYMEGDGESLFFMVDWTNSPEVNLPPNTFFDVWFRDALQKDTVIRFIDGLTVDVVQKSSASGNSSVKPDGSLNLNDPVWTHLPLGDPMVNSLQFTSGVTTGPSPNNPVDHLIIEFQIDQQIFGSSFYSSISAGSLVNMDPPIGAGNFIIRHDGQVVVFPVFDPNGAPAQQPPDLNAVPEPATLLLMGSGLGLLALLRRSKSKRSH